MLASNILSRDAEADVDNILEYTLLKFGERQMHKYKDQLKECLKRMSRDFGNIRSMKDVDPSLCFMRCQHHYIFGLLQNNRPIYIIAILHEKMDLTERIKERLNK